MAAPSRLKVVLGTAEIGRGSMTEDQPVSYNIPRTHEDTLTLFFFLFSALNCWMLTLQKAKNWTLLSCELHCDNSHHTHPTPPHSTPPSTPHPLMYTCLYTSHTYTTLTPSHTTVTRTHTHPHTHALTPGTVEAYQRRLLVAIFRLGTCKIRSEQNLQLKI